MMPELITSLLSNDDKLATFVNAPALVFFLCVCVFFLVLLVLYLEMIVTD